MELDGVGEKLGNKKAPTVVREGLRTFEFSGCYINNSWPKSRRANALPS